MEKAVKGKNERKKNKTETKTQGDFLLHVTSTDKHTVFLCQVMSLHPMSKIRYLFYQI